MDRVGELVQMNWAVVAARTVDIEWAYFDSTGCMYTFILMMLYLKLFCGLHRHRMCVPRECDRTAQEIVDKKLLWGRKLVSICTR